jgi:hypothetical protein
MNSEQFITWLSRFLELATELHTDKILTKEQLKTINDKLKLVTKHTKEPYINEVSKCSCWQNGLTYCPIHGRKNGWCAEPSNQPPGIIT